MIKKKNIIIISVLMVLLIAAYFFAINYTPATEKTPVTPENEVTSITVYETDSEKITKVSIENETPFTIVKKDGTWYLEGKEDIDIVQSAASSISYNAGYIYAVTEIKDNSDLALFGLDVPAASIEVYTGDSSRKFLLGSKTPTDNYYYMKAADSDNVYTVSESTASVFLKNPSSVRNLNLWEVDITKVTGAELISPSETLKVDYTPLEDGASNPYGTISVWTISSPFNHRAENKKVIENFLTPSTSINAEAVIEDKPSSLEKYGLNKTFTLKTNEKNYTLKIGNSNGVNYVYYPEKDIVYSLSSASLAFSDITGYDLIERLIVIPQITELDNVEIKTANVSAKLSVKKKAEDAYTYQVNGSYADESAFKAAYQKVIGLTFDGVIRNNLNTTSPIGSVGYTMASGDKILIELYEYDDLNVAVKYDGKIQFFMKRTKLSDMENALSSFIKNPKNSQ